MREKLAELYAENIEGRFVPVLAALAAGAVGVLYYFDYVTELTAGAAMASAMVVICASIMITAALELGGLMRLAAFGLILLTAGAAALPVVATLRPGEPVVRGSLRERGDAVTLPEGASGPVRLLLHGAVAGGAGEVDYVLHGTTEPVKGNFVRKTQSARVGRGGRTTVMRERTTEFVTATVPAGTPKLVLHEVTGQLGGPIEVVVFRDWWPMSYDVPLMLLLIAALVVLSARAKADAGLLSAAAVALFFGLFVYEFASPERSVRPEIGAVILSLLIGGSASGILAWLTKKLAGGERVNAR